MALPILSLQQSLRGQRMTSDHTKMQRSLSIVVLPFRSIDTILDVELTPFLHVLHDKLANDDEAKLSGIV